MDEGGGNKIRFKGVETVDTRCCANEEKIELTTNKKNLSVQLFESTFTNGAILVNFRGSGR